MKIEKVELREIRMPLVHPFETSFGRTTHRRILLVELVSEGLRGWGEMTAGEGPFYSYETTETAWHVLKDFLIPRLLGQELTEPAEAAKLVKPIRGHSMAKGALEAALWHLESLKQGVPLSKLLGGEIEEISCGVSLGIEGAVEELLERVEKELAAGYQRIKVKIKPGWDTDILEAIRNRFPDIRLMADANAAYTISDLPRLKSLDRFCLMMIEQPLAWDDIVDHAALQKELSTPICLDESITSVEKARKAIDLGACKIINIKLGRVGGFSEAKKIHDLCRARQIPVWCGGMLEAGIGRAHNISLSTLPNFLLPGDVSASRRYWEQDIIEPEVTVTPQGTIPIKQEPGLGYAVSLERIEKLAVRKESFS